MDNLRQLFEYELKDMYFAEHALNNLGAGAKAERYEISAYESLIGMADKLGMKNSVPLLRDNLQEEEQALSIVTNLSKTMVKSGNMVGAAR